MLECAVRTILFAVDAPSFNLRSGLVERAELVNLQALFAQSSIKRLAKTTTRGLRRSFSLLPAATTVEDIEVVPPWARAVTA